jgi:YidC/Oxa1 family membrane protein insertase
MEKFDKNTLWGILLMLAIYGIGMTFINKDEEAKKNTTPQKVVPKGNSNTGVISTPVDSIIATVVKNLEISNEQLTVNISSKGAQVSEVLLKNFKSYDDYVANKNENLKLYGNKQNSQQLILQSGGQNINLSDLNFSSTANSKESVSFTANTPVGPVIKTLTLQKDSYEVKETYDFSGLKQLGNIQYKWVNQLNKLEHDVLENRKAAQINYFDIEENFNDVGFGSPASADDKTDIAVKWASFKQKYFTSGVIAEQAPFLNASFRLDSPIDPATNEIKTGTIEGTIDGSKLGDRKLNLSYFYGPNDLKILQKAGSDFQKNLYLGYDIVKPINRYVFVPLFNWVESFIKNYGLLIIIVVLIIKLAVTPLIYKSYVSSAKMRILAPEVNAIKEKIGDDAMKVQQETMKLYQQVGVSPLSGCVPMLLQMPILMSVFFLFPNMLMFRQKEFLWAKDLSTYDFPISWGFDIPIIGSHISLFVVLMTLSSLAFTYYNNQITPDQPGPIDMKKISYIMPLIFFFVLNSFPAALSFYYLVSNLVTIGQQTIIRRFVDENKIHALLEENRKNYQSKPQKKNKFAEFLDKQVKASEEFKKQTEDRKKTIKKK